MFGLRIINGAGLQNGPLHGNPFHTRRSFYPLPPGCDTVAIHFGWSSGRSGEGHGQGAVPLDESNYVPGSEPLDIALYKCRADQVGNVLNVNRGWQIEYLEFVRVLTPQERDLAYERRREYLETQERTGSALWLNVDHTNKVAKRIALATIDVMGKAPAYCAMWLRGLRDQIAAEIGTLYRTPPVGGFSRDDFMTLSKQGDETRA